MAYLYFPKNIVSPDDYFLNEKPMEIHLEFKKGGNLNYSSNIPDGIITVDDEKSINEFYEMFKTLDFDIKAPHRGDRDYSVYINTGTYRKSKYLIKMSRINGGYVFFFKDGLYRNDKLAQKINNLLEIQLN